MVGFEVEAIALGLGPCHAQRWPTPLSEMEPGKWKWQHRAEQRDGPEFTGRYFDQD